MALSETRGEGLVLVGHTVFEVIALCDLMESTGH